MFVPVICDQLQIFYAVITLDSVFVMNYFPILKAPSYAFCHYEPVLRYTSCFISHGKKEIISVHIDFHVTSGGHYPSAVPTRARLSTWLDSP